jgi:hypothetical protein
MACSSVFPMGDHIVNVASDIISSTANTSLVMLKAVDATVDALVRQQEELGKFLGIVAELTTAVNEAEPTCPLDPEDRLHDGLSDVEGHLKVAVESMKARRNAAREDPRLVGEHEGAVVHEYDHLIDIAAQVHDAVQELRWAVLEHDADLDQPLGEPTASLDELIARLEE